MAVNVSSRCKAVFLAGRYEWQPEVGAAAVATDRQSALGQKRTCNQVKR